MNAFSEINKKKEGGTIEIIKETIKMSSEWKIILPFLAITVLFITSYFLLEYFKIYSQGNGMTPKDALLMLGVYISSNLAGIYFIAWAKVKTIGKVIEKLKSKHHKLALKSAMRMDYDKRAFLLLSIILFLMLAILFFVIAIFAVPLINALDSGQMDEVKAISVNIFKTAMFFLGTLTVVTYILIKYIIVVMVTKQTSIKEAVGETWHFLIANTGPVMKLKIIQVILLTIPVPIVIQGVLGNKILVVVALAYLTLILLPINISTTLLYFKRCDMDGELRPFLFTACLLAACVLIGLATVALTSPFLSEVGDWYAEEMTQNWNAMMKNY